MRELVETRGGAPFRWAPLWLTATSLLFVRLLSDFVGLGIADWWHQTSLKCRTTYAAAAGANVLSNSADSDRHRSRLPRVRSCLNYSNNRKKRRLE